jgi:hypothetical protein
MTKSLRERGLLKEGETVDKHIERSRMQHMQEKEERPRRDRPERPHRPERPERK